VYNFALLVENSVKCTVICRTVIMLSDRSPKSTKEVAKKLEGAQLHDEQTV